MPSRRLAHCFQNFYWIFPLDEGYHCNGNPYTSYDKEEAEA